MGGFGVRSGGEFRREEAVRRNPPDHRGRLAHRNPRACPHQDEMEPGQRFGQILLQLLYARPYLLRMYHNRVRPDHALPQVPRQRGASRHNEGMRIRTVRFILHDELYDDSIRENRLGQHAGAADEVNVRFEAQGNRPSHVQSRRPFPGALRHGRRDWVCAGALVQCAQELLQLCERGQRAGRGGHREDPQFAPCESRRRLSVRGGTARTRRRRRRIRLLQRVAVLPPEHGMGRGRVLVPQPVQLVQSQGRFDNRSVSAHLPDERLEVGDRARPQERFAAFGRDGDGHRADVRRRLAADGDRNDERQGHLFHRRPERGLRSGADVVEERLRDHR